MGLMRSFLLCVTYGSSLLLHMSFLASACITIIGKTIQCSQLTIQAAILHGHIFVVRRESGEGLGRRAETSLFWSGEQPLASGDACRRSEIRRPGSAILCNCSLENSLDVLGVIAVGTQRRDVVRRNCRYVVVVRVVEDGQTSAVLISILVQKI